MIKNTLIFAGMLLITSVGVYLINYFVEKKIKGKLDERGIPMTIYLLKAALFISFGLLVQEMLVPIQTLIKVLPSTNTGGDLKVSALKYFSLMATVTFFIFVLVWWFSTLFFGLFSAGRNIYMEGLNDSHGLLILFTGILLAFIFASKPCLAFALEYFIPYPNMPIFR